MSSVEGNENIEESFNKILQEEYKQKGELIVIPQKFVALLCYCLPALLMFSSADYHNQNVMAILFFSALIGTGFYGYYHSHAVIRSFFSNEKPSIHVIRSVEAQQSVGQIPQPAPDSRSLTEEEESDWGIIVAQLEKSMEMEEEESDSMNLSSLFDRAETEQATLPQTRTSWFKRFFGRN